MLRPLGIFLFELQEQIAAYVCLAMLGAVQFKAIDTSPLPYTFFVVRTTLDPIR
jgi:hypothetical protein